ncbi:uracil-DNA glycosylase [Frondihabitans australicus]|uniref:Uracil DNA glycosylase superfamily protein n=1 Tax=Frondihabitans australicus TaxID=386892 RepID=A0A495ILB0_9MICO|nr:uracil-DNA glycosylase [Frondihabitans australicus]RKR76549.1 hypothetical protein C8E83_3726 [Frondihabitans australicus]
MTVGSGRFDRFLELLDGVPAAPDAEALYRPQEPAGALRRRNLLRYLTLLADSGSRMILVGEAPGWRGATNTGVSFMSVRELSARPGLMTHGPDGDGFELPEHPTAPWEASSRVVWAALADWPGPLPVAWPIFPHHPHVAGDPLTNRTPRPAEVRAGVPVALALIDAFGGDLEIVAVGRKAQGALAENGVDAVAVRHPAQGGAALFTQQVRALALARS